MRLIVTGADGALGQAVVRRHIEAGDRVAQLCGAADSVDDAVSGRLAAGNLADEEAAGAAIGRAVEWLGTVDAFVHLVGGFRWIEIRAARLTDWRAMFDANVAAAVASVGAVLPVWRTVDRLCLSVRIRLNRQVRGSGHMQPPSRA